MPKFMLAFRGGMPKTEEEGKTMMEAWNAWMADPATGLTDPGMGLGKSRFLESAAAEGTCPAPLSGYSVIEVADMEAALAVARRNPIFSLGGTIEVAPAMTI